MSDTVEIKCRLLGNGAVFYKFVTVSEGTEPKEEKIFKVNIHDVIYIEGENGIDSITMPLALAQEKGLA